MTRPLALIEGNLAIPLPRPHDGLPPPFGARHRPIGGAVHEAVREIATPARSGRSPSEVRHVLVYKEPPQRVEPGRWDVALAEAKRYLEMDRSRPRSSRSDRLLAASIFGACTIALTWLLVTCSMKEAEKAKAAPDVPTVLSALSSRVDAPKSVDKPTFANAQTGTVIKRASPETVTAFANEVARPVIAETPRAVSKSELAQTEPLPSVLPKQIAKGARMARRSHAESKYAVRILPRQTVQLSIPDEDTPASRAKPPKRVKVAQLSRAHVHARVAMSHAMHPATHPALSKQPDWTTRAAHLHRDASIDSAPWLNWSAQQHRPGPTIHRAAPASGDSNWNDHMTQRRITDDPAAFHIGGGK